MSSRYDKAIASLYWQFRNQQLIVKHHMIFFSILGLWLHLLISEASGNSFLCQERCSVCMGVYCCQCLLANCSLTCTQSLPYIWMRMSGISNQWWRSSRGKLRQQSIPEEYYILKQGNPQEGYPLLHCHWWLGHLTCSQLCLLQSTALVQYFLGTGGNIREKLVLHISRWCFRCLKWYLISHNYCISTCRGKCHAKHYKNKFKFQHECWAVFHAELYIGWRLPTSCYWNTSPPNHSFDECGHLHPHLSTDSSRSPYVRNSKNPWPSGYLALIEGIEGPATSWSWRLWTGSVNSWPNL